VTIAICHGIDPSTGDEVILRFHTFPPADDVETCEGDQSLERAARLASELGLTRKSGPDHMGTTVWVPDAIDPSVFLSS
jgi:hypothetical protein